MKLFKRSGFSEFNGLVGIRIGANGGKVKEFVGKLSIFLCLGTCTC